MQRILIIDDETDLLTALFVLLKRNGFEVKTLSTVIDITSVIDEFKPGVIILDVHLGHGIDGRHIATQIKEAFPNNFKIILSSAYEELYDSYSEFGADAFLGKPVKMENLLTVLKDITAAKA